MALIKEKQRLVKLWKGPKKCKKDVRRQEDEVVWAWKKDWKGGVQCGLCGYGKKEAGPGP